MMANTQKPTSVTGRHVLMMMVAFFGVIFAVQAAFITVAVYTHSGVVSKQPYRKGLKYGERIDMYDRQQKLGWQETLTTSKDNRTLTVVLIDQYKKPVLGLKLVGKIGRPVTMSQDKPLTFKSIGEGSYTTQLPYEKLEGAYIVDLQAAHPTPDAEIIWRSRKRLWLKP